MPKKIIMCVDDEQVVLTSLIGQLNNTFGNRYLYEGFTSAEEAEEYIDELYAEGQTVDLIICDWLMPRVKGDEFMVNVHKRFPHVQMIMLSGQADQASVERAKAEARLYKFVAKPWDKAELMAEIERLIAKPLN
ncbi:MAG: response regulator [Bacteroidetes bacterium]|jgi:DNA-binding NtrC family response regulator|nr:response regulator [Bacteroidota bacterium]